MLADLAPGAVFVDDDNHSVSGNLSESPVDSEFPIFLALVCWRFFGDSAFHKKLSPQQIPTSVDLEDSIIATHHPPRKLQLPQTQCQDFLLPTNAVRTELPTKTSWMLNKVPKGFWMQMVFCFEQCLICVNSRFLKYDEIVQFTGTWMDQVVSCIGK